MTQQTMQTVQALKAFHLWQAFSLQASAQHWDSMSMLCAVATGKALPLSLLADVADIANQG